MAPAIRLASVVALLVAALSCHRERLRTEPVPTRSARNQQAAPEPVRSHEVHPEASSPADATLPPVENIALVADGLLSGAQPECDADFDALAAYGVRTVISVDGAVPDEIAARARGMRYVHLPIGYDGVDPEQCIELTRAVRDLPKPIYMHCHHGKHRGPAAAAVAAIGNGAIDSSAGRALLEKVGTSPQYPGLWKAVEEMRSLADAVIDTAPDDFPERAAIGDFTAAMAEVDRAFDHLMLIRDAGWRTPTDHPDLVPLAEAARLADILRHLRDDPYTRGKPDDFRKKLADAVAHATVLESAVAKVDADAGKQALDALNTSCKQCHRHYRD